MSNLEYENPSRYDFKAVYEDYDMISVQKIDSEFGQYVSYDAYWKLLCEFAEYKQSQE